MFGTNKGIGPGTLSRALFLDRGPHAGRVQVFELVKGAEHYQLLTVISKEDGVQKLAPFLDVEIDLKDVFG